MLRKYCLLWLCLLLSIGTQAQTISAVKSGDWSSDTTWNLNRIPNITDDVLINGFTVDVSTNAQARSIEVNCSTGSTFLELDGSGNVLEVDGDLRIINENLGTVKEARVHVFGLDSVYVAGQLLFERKADATSSGKCKLWMTSQSKLHVANGLNYNYLTSGPLDDKWEIYLQDTVFVRVDGGMNFNISGGEILNMKLVGEATLLSNGDLNLTSTGGKGLQMVVADKALLDINGTVNMENQNTKDSAVVELATTITGGNIIIANDLNINSSIADQVSAVNILGDTTQLDVRGDITFAAVSEEDVILNVENKAKVFLGGNFYRQIDFGGVAMSDSSQLILNGNAQQELPGNFTQASSTDYFQISNIAFDNQSGNGFVLSDSFVVEKKLSLINGIIETSATAPLILNDGAIISGGSATAYVDGPVTKEGGVTGDGFTFPLGDNGVYAAMSISIPKSGAATTSYTASYIGCPPPLGGSLDHDALVTISGNGHWEFSRSDTSPDVDVTLHWDDAAAQGILDLMDLRIAAYHPDSLEWFSLGNGGTTGGTGNNSGSILNAIGCPPPLGSSMFAFGSSDGNNPLPVVLSNFQAQVRGAVVVVDWETQAASNANYFSLERSRNGLNFSEIERRNAINGLDQVIHYSTQDLNPQNGINYYRLCVIDDLGMKVYSRIQPVTFGAVSETQAFPNPAVETLNVKGDFKVQAYPIAIYSVTGQLLHQEVILGEKGYLKIDIHNSQLGETGMMYLKITNNGLVQTIPFIKA